MNMNRLHVIERAYVNSGQGLEGENQDGTMTRDAIIRVSLHLWEELDQVGGLAIYAKYIQSANL